MRIIDRYIGRTVIGATLTVLVVLLGLFTFFSFIEELEDVGKGVYTLSKVGLYEILSLPGLAYQLFPMAALVGSLIGFGTLMRNGEITVIRCAGVPKLRVVISVLKGGGAVVLAAMLIGEFVAPRAERYASDFRDIAINDRITFRGQHGFWARDGDSYINIREILPGNRISDIYIYQFDSTNRLRISTHAARAYYHKSQWILEDIAQTTLKGTELTKRFLEKAAWDSMLKPDLISMVTINPDSLSIWDLLKYSDFLRTNGQDTRRYEHALWVRLAYPLATAMMVILAVPMVLKANRSTTVGKAILVGGVVGLGFHLLNQAAGHIGIVYAWPPLLSAVGPLLLITATALVLLARTP